MPGTHPTSHGSGARFRLLMWAERLLLTAGIAVMGWCALAIVERHVVQYLAHESLVAMPRVEEGPASRVPGRPAVSRPQPATGTALAELTIPRVNLSAVVLQGSDARTLRAGAGHIENTALPGDPGNVAIAGHRDSFFRPLRNIRVGDEVLLDTPQGRVRYRVSTLRVVPPTEVSVLLPTPDATLTLVTCYPFWVLGHAPDRFIVRAIRIPDTEMAAALVSSAIEPTRTSMVEQPASATRATATVRPSEATAIRASIRRDSVSDEVLVRQAIERFRLIYNARFSVPSEQGGRLMFQGCQVVVDGESAIAACRTASPQPDRLEVLERTFALRKAGSDWMIRSSAMDP